MKKHADEVGNVCLPSLPRQGKQTARHTGFPCLPCRCPLRGGKKAGKVSIPGRKEKVFSLTAPSVEESLMTPSERIFRAGEGLADLAAELRSNPTATPDDLDKSAKLLAWSMDISELIGRTSNPEDAR